MCVWDVLGGGRLLARLSNHQKTVTSLAVSPLAGPASSAAPRLLTGSLDGHIKIFELDQFKVCGLREIYNLHAYQRVSFPDLVPACLPVSPSWQGGGHRSKTASIIVGAPSSFHWPTLYTSPLGR